MTWADDAWLEQAYEDRYTFDEDFDVDGDYEDTYTQEEGEDE